MATHVTPAPAPPAAAPPVAAPGWSGQQPYPPPPPPPIRAGRVRGPIGLWILAGVAAVASIAALVLGVIAVVGTPSQVQSAPTTPPAAASAAPILFDDKADRALCQALPDLMRESTSRRNAFIATAVNSPERRAAIPRFKAESEDWALRMQQVIAAHSEPSRYLTRTVQRYVDDVLLYSQNVYPERPYDKFDDATWNLAVVDYGGALGRCQQLGIRW